jgi:hypothetical protein
MVCLAGGSAFPAYRAGDPTGKSSSFSDRRRWESRRRSGVAGAGAPGHGRTSRQRDRILGTISIPRMPVPVRSGRDGAGSTADRRRPEERGTRLFIPGNHDWFRMGKKAGMRCGAPVLSGSAATVSLPGAPDGCPVRHRRRAASAACWMPVVAAAGGFSQARDSSNTCGVQRRRVVRQLTRVLADTGRRHVIVAGHNPWRPGNTAGISHSRLTSFHSRRTSPGSGSASPAGLAPIHRPPGRPVDYAQDMSARASGTCGASCSRAMAPIPLALAAGRSQSASLARPRATTPW